MVQISKFNFWDFIGIKFESNLTNHYFKSVPQLVILYFVSSLRVLRFFLLNIPGVLRSWRLVLSVNLGQSELIGNLRMVSVGVLRNLWPLQNNMFSITEKSKEKIEKKSKLSNITSTVRHLLKATACDNSLCISARTILYNDSGFIRFNLMYHMTMSYIRSRNWSFWPQKWKILIASGRIA